MANIRRQYLGPRRHRLGKAVQRRSMAVTSCWDRCRSTPDKRRFPAVNRRQNQSQSTLNVYATWGEYVQKASDPAVADSGSRLLSVRRFANVKPGQYSRASAGFDGLYRPALFVDADRYRLQPVHRVKPAGRYGVVAAAYMAETQGKRVSGE